MKYIFLRRLKYILISLFLAIIITELLLEVIAWRKQRRFAQQVKPFYSWELLTTNGRRISSNRGVLKLTLNPRRGYIYLPNQRHSAFSINSYGVRGPEPDLKDNIILISGSSFAFGTGLGSDSETFAYKLNEQFENYTVINTAVIGYSSGQEETAQVEWMEKITPSLVISVGGWNDFHFAAKGIPAPLAVHGEWLSQIEVELERNSHVKNLDPFSRLFLGIPKLVFPEIWKRSFTFSKGFEAKKNLTDEKIAAVAKEYIKRISAMARHCRASGVGFLLVLQPDLNAIRLLDGQRIRSDSLNLFGKSYLSYLDQVKQVARELKVPVVDLNLHGSKFKEELFLDAIHLNAEGNKSVANILLPEVNRILAGNSPSVLPDDGL